MKTDQIKPIYHNLIDDKVYEYIAKKFSNLIGDIRAAFDMMRNVLNSFAEKLKLDMIPVVKVTVNHLLENQQHK